MPRLPNHPTPTGLLEYSVVFTDRAVNHMSQSFQQTVRALADELTAVYRASSLAFVPGGGTYAMEAVARQFGQVGPVLVVRNGWFTYRWSQIFAASGGLSPAVLCAAPTTEGPRAAFAPPPLDEVVSHILQHRPTTVITAHVETASGILLPDDYIYEIGRAARNVGALFVLDCIASGALWVDMNDLQVDILLTAPQKGWSAPAGVGVVLLGPRARARLETTESSSFSLDLKRWHAIMEAYQNGGHAYHTTMPTDVLVAFHDAVIETRQFGFEKCRQAQWDLGNAVRDALASRGCPSVAAAGFAAPGVVVVYTPQPGFAAAAAFAREGIQVAAGVPLQCGEGPSFETFRIGLFGLDKLRDVQGTVDRFVDAATRAMGPSSRTAKVPER